jgi:hypothetical protein
VRRRLAPSRTPKRAERAHARAIRRRRISYLLIPEVAMDMTLDFVCVVIGTTIGILVSHWIEKRFLIPSTIRRFMLCVDREHPEASNVFARVFAKRVTDGGFSGYYEAAFDEAIDAATFVEKRFNGLPTSEPDSADWWKEGKSPD